MIAKPMTEPVWQRTGGRITKHPRKSTWFVHRGMTCTVFHDLDEAKTWLLTIAKLEN